MCRSGTPFLCCGKSKSERCVPFTSFIHASGPPACAASARDARDETATAAVAAKRRPRNPRRCVRSACVICCLLCSMLLAGRVRVLQVVLPQQILAVVVPVRRADDHVDVL